MSNLSKELVEMQILLRKHKVPQRSIDKIINRERNMQEELDKYKTTVELYQPYFKGVDIIKTIGGYK